MEEYYIYDPDDGDLIGYRRVGTILQEIPDMAGYVSPRLGIRFEPGDGPDNLTIIGPDGERFRTYLEVLDQRDGDAARADDAERRSVEAERQSAEAERRSAEAERLAQTERHRAERLVAKLRELGIEPD